MRNFRSSRLAKAALVAVVSAASAAGAGVTAAAATSPTSHKSSAQAGTVSAGAASLGRRRCPLPRYPNSRGRSLQLVTFHMSCASGRRLALAHYRCRVKSGRKGLCSEKTRILGYECQEGRLLNRGYYEGRVECTSGNRVTVFVYRQR